MSTAKFSCRIENSDPGCALSLEIWLDQQQIFDQPHVRNSMIFEHEFEDDEADHELRFVLKNKLPEHTQIDANNQILQDAVIRIFDLVFDDLPVPYNIINSMIYTHDHNGTGQLVEDKFYECMGCNGTVSLKFSTPIYLWFLEHM